VDGQTVVRADDLFSSLFWFLFGAFVTATAWRLEIGPPAAPGPGFFPFWSGLSLCLLALVVTALSAAQLRQWSERLRWRDVYHPRMLICLAAVSGYVAALKYTGFLLGTFLLMAILYGMDGRTSWRAKIVGAAATAVAAYLLFERALAVGLPPGWLRVWP
jgi:hypothetical protein